ncbi:MAG: rod-binding protein [Bdellovibrio sp.]
MAVDGLKGGAMPLRKAFTPEQQEARLKDVSKQYEKQFLGEMLKAMRGTVQEGGLVKVSQAEKIFRDQLDGEHVDKWADKGGIGLQDIIYDQLMDKYGTQLGIKTPVAKPRGPIPLGDKSNFSGTFVQPHGAESKQKVTYRFDRTSLNEVQLQQPGLGSNLSANALKAPWDGVLTGSQRLGSEEHLVEVSHTNGLKSQLVFKGLPSPGLTGTSVQAGQTIGVLSPEAKSFFWSVENGPKSVSE